MDDGVLKELDQQLHDARLDLSSLRSERGEIQIRGTVDRPMSGGLIGVIARFPLLLRIRTVDEFAIEDDERVGELIVETVTFDGAMGELLFESAIPGRLRFRTKSPAVEVQIGDKPIATRRWGRWRDCP